MRPVPPVPPVPLPPCYESPCGVMSSYLSTLAAAYVAGYESPCGVMSCYAEVTILGQPCYESPCGVMRGVSDSDKIEIELLRIPMRGYEA